MTDQPSRDDFTDIPATDDLAQPRARHDGWSPDKQVAFLEALARTGNVRAAARYAGLSRESAPVSGSFIPARQNGRRD